MEPLASKNKTKNLEDFVGQGHLVGKDKPLRVAIEKKHLFFFYILGSPGLVKLLWRVFMQMR